MGDGKFRLLESSQACVEIGALIQRAATLMAPATDIPIRSVPGYWWDLQENFGDQIGAWIIEMITGRPAHNTMGDPAAGYGLVTVGSILTGDVQAWFVRVGYWNHRPSKQSYVEPVVKESPDRHPRSQR